MSALGRWLAGFTRRWHQHPHLCHTVDTVDGHSNRVCKIALELEPDLSRDALIYAIRHDDGESGLGDVSGWYKRENPGFSQVLDDAEKANRARIGVDIPVLSDYEAAIMRIADKLDAYLWMMHHAPHLAATRDWMDAREDLGVAALKVLNSKQLDAFNELINSHNGA